MALRDVEALERDRARIEELRAKHAVTPVAGPYGHPFHPLLVTVPIGAWVTSILFDILSRTADHGADFARGAYWLIGIGVVGALVAAAFGLMDLLAVPARTRAKRVGFAHMAFNLAVLAMFVGSFAWRANRDAYRPTSVALLVLSALALAVLAISGWLGGMLAYRYGVRVADEQTQLDGYLRNGRTTATTQRQSMN